MIFLLFIIAFTFSCTEKTSPEKAINKSKFISASEGDTLKFASGISSLFQDSKGNYWLGSRQEGVAVFNGKSFEYFTTNEGLTDNQIRSIQEDNYGNIWLETAKGVNSYDGKEVSNHTPIVNGESQTEWAPLLDTRQVHLGYMLVLPC